MGENHELLAHDGSKGGSAVNAILPLIEVAWEPYCTY